MKGVPFDYWLEQLARRWHVPPWVLEDEQHLDWLLRGLEILSIEGSIEVTRRGE